MPFHRSVQIRDELTPGVGWGGWHGADHRGAQRGGVGHVGGRGGRALPPIRHGTKLFGFGTGVLAYTLGMRHAFDADHIAAIDNTTRKLMQDGKRPLTSGTSFPSATPPSSSSWRYC